MFWCLSPLAVIWYLPDSAFFLPAFSLVFLPNSVLPCHRPKQLLYQPIVIKHIHNIQRGIPHQLAHYLACEVMEPSREPTAVTFPNRVSVKYRHAKLRLLLRKLLCIAEISSEMHNWPKYRGQLTMHNTSWCIYIKICTCKVKEQSGRWDKNILRARGAGHLL